MRWRIIDPNNQAEQAERAKIVARIDAWWAQFQKATGHLDALFSKKPGSAFKNSDDLVRWMDKYLHGIDPALMWEYGQAVHTKGHRLVITPESAHHLRPLVKTILKRAPQISGWEFYPHRLPEDAAATHQAVEARTGVDSSDYQVRIARGDDNRIDIAYFSPSISSPEDENASKAAFVATETLLGEELLDKWVGAIEVGPLKKPSAIGSLFGKKAVDVKHLIPLDRMKDTFDAVVHSVRDQLPAEPQWKTIENAEWGSVSLEPAEQDDYPERQDLIAAVTGHRAMWMPAHKGILFFSDRYSRCGETFCYVKIDGANGLGDDCPFADRGEMEDAIDEALKPEKLGCTIGGGTGIRYSYIDLALVDLGRGLQAIRKRLRSGRIPKRSWIQFFDSDFAAEWVGIYDDSPASPMPTYDE
jgi:hypothetical protein